MSIETAFDSISIELYVQAVGSVHDENDVYMHGSLVIAINRSRPYTENELVLPEALYSSLESGVSTETTPGTSSVPASIKISLAPGRNCSSSSDSSRARGSSTWAPDTTCESMSRVLDARPIATLRPVSP